MPEFFPVRYFDGWFFDERVGRRGARFTLKFTGATYFCHYEQDLPCKTCREHTNYLWEKANAKEVHS